MISTALVKLEDCPIQKKEHLILYLISDLDQGVQTFVRMVLDAARYNVKLNVHEKEAQCARLKLKYGNKFINLDQAKDGLFLAEVIQSMNYFVTKIDARIKKYVDEKCLPVRVDEMKSIVSQNDYFRKLGGSSLVLGVSTAGLFVPTLWQNWVAFFYRSSYWQVHNIKSFFATGYGWYMWWLSFIVMIASLYSYIRNRAMVENLIESKENQLADEKDSEYKDFDEHFSVKKMDVFYEDDEVIEDFKAIVLAKYDLFLDYEKELNALRKKKFKLGSFVLPVESVRTKINQGFIVGNGFGKVKKDKGLHLEIDWVTKSRSLIPNVNLPKRIFKKVSKREEPNCETEMNIAQGLESPVIHIGDDEEEKKEDKDEEDGGRILSKVNDKTKLIEDENVRSKSAILFTKKSNLNSVSSSEDLENDSEK